MAPVTLQSLKDALNALPEGQFKRVQDAIAHFSGAKAAATMDSMAKIIIKMYNMEQFSRPVSTKQYLWILYGVGSYKED